jgi:hypothetical protein
MDELTKKLYAVASQHVFECVKKAQPDRDDEWIHEKIREARLFELIDKIALSTDTIGLLIDVSGEKTEEYATLSRTANDLVLLCNFQMPIAEKMNLAIRLSYFLRALVQSGRRLGSDCNDLLDFSTYLEWLIGSAIFSSEFWNPDAKRPALKALLDDISTKLEDL